jgi:hypothetical protein
LFGRVTWNLWVLRRGIGGNALPTRGSTNARIAPPHQRVVRNPVQGHEVPSLFEREVRDGRLADDIERRGGLHQPARECTLARIVVAPRTTMSAIDGATAVSSALIQRLLHTAQALDGCLERPA